MDILVFAIVVILVAGLLVWACDSLPLGAPFGTILRVLIILVAALLIINRAGIV